MEIIRSVNDNQHQIIKDILKLHSSNGKVDLDMTYSKGVFYRDAEIEQPTHKFDFYPQTEDTVQAHCGNIPLENSCVDTIMFDPPFVIAGTKFKDNKEGSSIIAKRFHGFKDFHELSCMYLDAIDEGYRLLKDKGIMICKTQDTVSSGKTT